MEEPPPPEPGAGTRAARRFEHFHHGADVGVCGVGPTLAAAFEEAALALTAAVTDLEAVRPREEVEVRCEAPDRELACAPIRSPLGEEYLGAMRAAINCALANRQVLTHIVRRTFARVLPEARLELLYDVSHNTCKEEEHEVGGGRKRLFVHRKGATRAFGPGHPDLTPAL